MKNILFNPFSHSLNIDNRNYHYNPIETKFNTDAVYSDGDFAIYEKREKHYLHCYKHVIFAELCGINEQLITDIKNDLFCGDGNQYHNFDRPKQALADGLLWSKDNTLTYFIKRFDRKGQNDKVPVEDFAQLAGLNRDTKYDYSMEKIVKLIDDYCTFPAIEKVKLFKLVIFNYLIGNEDSHLKNFSIITDDNQVRLSPCYDLVNSSIVLKEQAEEIALPLNGKKKHLTRNILVNYFGIERCKLTEKSIEKVLETITLAIPKWKALIDISFLSKEMKDKYLDLLEVRLTTLKI